MTRLCVHCGESFVPRWEWQIRCRGACKPPKFTRHVVCACGITFTTHTPKIKKWCTPKCKSAHYAKSVNLPTNKNLPTGTVGAISELVVSTDLLNKGYEVFRALSASCSCDLAILKDGKLTRVEVRTGYKTKSGRVSHNYQNFRADVMATVVHGVIYYEPNLAELPPPR